MTLDNLITNNIHSYLKENVSPMLKESMGVNNDMLRISQGMAKEIVLTAIPKILSSTDYIESWKEDWGKEYSDRFEEYVYTIFYDENDMGLLKGEWDDGVRLNWAFIEKTFLEYEERLENIDEDDFDADAYCQNALDNYEWQKLQIYSQIQPVILHELTHGLNADADPFERVWIKDVNRFDEEDVRNFMYQFSESEMNSRIASIGPVMHNAMKYFESSRDIARLKQEGSAGFYEILREHVWNSDELNVNYMEMLLSSLERGVREEDEFKSWCNANGEEYDPNHLKLQIQNALQRSLPYDIFYSLAINESGLFKKRPLKNVKQLYINNPQAFREKVYNFYANKLKKYKERIIRACWEVWTNEGKYSLNIDNEENW